MLGSVGWNEPKRSSHPRLNDDDPGVGFQDYEHPLAAALDALHLTSACEAFEGRAVGALEQERVVDFDGAQKPSGQSGPQPANHRFNFGKFRHSPSPAVIERLATDQTNGR